MKLVYKASHLKSYSNLGLKGHYLCFIKLFSEALFFYGVTERRNLQGSYPTLEDALEFSNTDVMNKISDIIHHFKELTKCWALY